MKSLKRTFLYSSLLLIAVSMLIPFLWMLSTSLMGELEVYQFPPRFIPSIFRWSNYAEAMTLQPFGRFFLNTIIVAGASVVGQLAFCSTAAYAFARLRFPSRDKVFALYLGTMMIPAIVTIIPAFLLIDTFGWMNTYWALFTPAVSIVFVSAQKYFVKGITMTGLNQEMSA